MIFMTDSKRFDYCVSNIRYRLKQVTIALHTIILAAFFIVSSPITHADIGATHSTLVSEFASFNTPGVVDGRVEAIAVDGDKVFVGGTFTQIHDPLSDEIIDQAGSLEAF